MPTETSPQTPHDGQDAEEGGEPVQSRAFGTSLEAADIRMVSSFLVAKLKYPPRFIYAVPTGGTSALPYFLEALRAEYPGHFPAVLSSWGDAPIKDVLVFDDIVDSGRTLRPYAEAGSQTCALIRVPAHGDTDFCITGWTLLAPGYVHFPWEAGAPGSGPEDAVRRLLQFMGYDPDADHLRDTPRRVLNWYSRFSNNEDLPFTPTTFNDVTYGGMVLVRDISFVSLCEHHLLPFTGRAAVAYIPNGGTVIGLSKLARFVQHYASRLQVQERMTEEIAVAVSGATSTRDVAVLVTAQHECMAYRGPEDEHHQTITSSLFGSFQSDGRAREEFMMLARG